MGRGWRAELKPFQPPGRTSGRTDSSLSRATRIPWSHSSNSLLHSTFPVFSPACASTLLSDGDASCSSLPSHRCHICCRAPVILGRVFVLQMETCHSRRLPSRLITAATGAGASTSPGLNCDALPIKTNADQKFHKHNFPLSLLNSGRLQAHSFHHNKPSK